MVATGVKKPKGRLDAAAQARHEALALVEEQFRDLDVVWAKVIGFPWWPGVLFSSWDAVRQAGIRTDAKLVTSLVVPPPEKTPVLDAATGEETGAFRFRRHCLVMFLDKFNFSVVEIDPRNVASYTAHYELYVRAVVGRKSAKKTDFRRALQQADKLLHLGEEYSEQDLVMLEEPTPAEKKQRMEVAMEGEDLVEEDAASLEDAWDDREADDEAAFQLDEKEERKIKDKKKPKRSHKVKTIAPANKQNEKQTHALENATVDDSAEIVVLETPAKARRKAPAKELKPRARKASRKEGFDVAHVAVVSPSVSPIDLTHTPESEKKSRVVIKDRASGKPPRSKKKKLDSHAAAEPKKKKKGPVKALVLEIDDDSEYISSSDVDTARKDTVREEHQSEPVLTPLSSIWTASEPISRGAGTHSQLAYKQAFVWDDAVFTDDLSIAEREKAALEQEQAEIAVANGVPGRERALGKRQSRSVQQSQIRQNLMTGNLDPHTMVQCAAYRPRDYVDDPNSRSRGGPTLDPPFRIVVHPDAVFVADLHAHLATCEIIGFLGGKWDESSKTLYIQAAFPCRSLVIDGDDGSTDVEMDPGSEIELRGIIENAHLEVVGWYHSHPAFAPDPSVRDIENQTSYQQLFQRPNLGKEDDREKKTSEPFVGLIVGTYDTRRSTPVSLFRYFHTRGEKVSGGARREIYMPYEFIPARRHFRSVLEDEERQKTRTLPIYPSVLLQLSLKQSFIKPEQIQAVVQATPSRRVRLSPTRVRAHGPIRKRKQSSDAASDKPVKKVKARSKRGTRCSPTRPAHVDLTAADGDDNALQKEQPTESTPTKWEMVNTSKITEMAVNSTPTIVVPSAAESNDVKVGSYPAAAEAKAINSDEGAGQKKEGLYTTSGDVGDSKAITSTPDALSAVKYEKECVSGVTISAESIKADVLVDNLEMARDGRKAPPTNVASCAQQEHTVAKEPKAAVHIVETEVNEVVADVSASTEATASNKRKRSRKSHRPQRIAEPNEGQDPVDEAGAGRLFVGLGGPSSGLSQQDDQKPGNLETRKSIEMLDVEAPISSSPGARPGLSPATSVSSSSSSGRKRNRKPRKTMKNGNRSMSPSRDGPPPRRSPSPSNGFYNAFQASGPRISNGGYQDVSHQSRRSNSPRPETLVAEDMQYIVVEDDDVKMEVPTAGNGRSASDHGLDIKDIPNMKAEKDGDGKSSEISLPSAHEAPSSGTVSANAPPPRDPQKSMIASGYAAMTMGSATSAVNNEIRDVVVSLVERVVAECVPRVAQTIIRTDPTALQKRSDKVNGGIVYEKVTTSTVNSLLPANHGDVSGQDTKVPVTLESAASTNTHVKVLESPVGKPFVKGGVKVEVETANLASQFVPNTCMSERPVVNEENPNVIASVSPGSQFFGNNRACEDIQTSLQKMAKYMDKLKAAQIFKPDETKVRDAVPVAENKVDSASESQIVLVEPANKQADSESLLESQQTYVTALRAKYGAGMCGCTEQVITLVDYYRDFERRTDLNEIWKSQITKLEKIESSLSEYVQFLNMPVALRHDFIKDLMSYLRVTWRVGEERR